MDSMLLMLWWRGAIEQHVLADVVAVADFRVVVRAMDQELDDGALQVWELRQPAPTTILRLLAGPGRGANLALCCFKS